MPGQLGFFYASEAKGGVYENPNVEQFLKNVQALPVINSTCAAIGGNCRDSEPKA